MRSVAILTIAIALFAVHGASTAAAADSTNAVSKIKKTKKTKKASTKKTKVAMLKSSARTTQPKEDPVAIAASLERYKKELAQKISDADPAKIHTEQPQALLRSVVVVRFTVDKNGKLVSSAIQRSNHDPVTEQAALASLRNAAPLPKPPPELVKKGHLDLLETWLFNTDGRFQMRSIAQAQKSE